jgi:hypothetical protein
MNTIYDPAPDDIKKMPLSMFFSVALFGILGPANFPDYWWLYGIIVTLAFGYTLVMIYLNESYIFFVRGFFSVIIFLLMFSSACFANMLVISDLGGTSHEGLTISSALLLFGFIIYIIIYLGSSKKFPFSISGKKVSHSTVDATGKYAGLIAGIGTLAASGFIKIFSPLTVNAIISVGFFFCYVAMLVHSRHLIRGLRTLHIQQKTMPGPYTFMQIDEIREARSRWWLSRLFKWVASWRKGPGA